MSDEYIEFEIYGVMVRYYDDDRIDRFMTERWTAKWKTMKQSNSGGYKIFCIGDNKFVSVHRLVYKAHNLDWDITDNSKNNFIDHIDRVRSNNKIENLQVATQQQNSFNTNAKGFYFDKRRNKYQAHIKLDGKKIHLGCFVKEDDAHNAYLEAKLIYHI